MPHPRSTLALVAAVGVLSALVLGAPAGHAAPDPASPVATAPAVPAGAKSYTLTLVTGDVARLSVLPDGRQSAALVPQPGKVSAGYQTSLVKGDLRLVPAEAYPYLAAGRLDPELFNLTSLVEQGFAGRTLPLLLTPTAANARARKAPAMPEALARQRTFNSLATLAVTPRDGQVRTFWESVDDDSRTVRPTLANGIDKIWLDARVKATLDKSTRQIGADKAWQAGLDGKGVKVAVLDTGYDQAHPDLKQSVESSKSFVPEESVQDLQGHGTHVASTIAGSGAASTGGKVRKGVAPGASLLVGKVLDNSGSGYDSWILAGMEWAIANGAKVVSMSLGGAAPSDGSDPLSKAVDTMSANSGTLFVIAAGNAGPNATTVTFPGAATSALTVGAVDRDGALAPFSSRGPRLGDRMVKPEVTAPGVGIVAARAAGTHIGSDLGEYYTGLSGTSMATPHVAGAAAIVAQKHPTWTGQQLKNALVSSARPSAKASAAEQGLGLVDIPAALRGDVVGTSSIALGTIAWTGTERPNAERTLSYTNTGSRSVTVRLSADVANIAYGRHPDARVRFFPSTLKIAPGKTATAKVALDVDGTRPGTYAGRVVARTSNGTTVQTAYSAVVGGELNKLTVDVTDRLGRPADGALTSLVVQSIDAEVLTAYEINAGKAVVQVPDGRYSVTVFATTEDEEEYPESMTLFAKPEIEVRGSTTVRFDARTAERVNLSTPKEADPNAFIIAWHRSVNGKHALLGWTLFGGTTKEVYVGHVERPRTGTFEVTHRWDLEQPLLTVDVLGEGGFKVPSPDGQWGTHFVGNATMRIVDAGTGTPAELAKANVAGAVALVRWTSYQNTRAQVQATAAAGAKVMLLWRDAPGYWSDGVWEGPIPFYTVQYEEGRRLHDLLVKGERQAKLVGVSDSTYRYDLMFVERQVRGPITYDARKLPMATITTDFHKHAKKVGKSESRAAWVEGNPVGYPITRQVKAPLHRTDFVNAGVWSTSSTADLWDWVGDEHGVNRELGRGDTAHQDVWGAITRPGIPDVVGGEADGLPVARYEDAIRALIPPFVSGDARTYGWNDNRGLQSKSTLSLHRNGKLVETFAGSAGKFPVPAASARYELRYDVTRLPASWADTSTATRSVWSFTSGHVRTRKVLSLLQVRYDVDVDLLNAVSRAGGAALTLRPGYQPGAAGPGRIQLRAEVSYDGKTWRTVGTSGWNAPLKAKLPKAPAGATEASLRVTAADRGGNKLVQTIENAWHLK